MQHWIKIGTYLIAFIVSFWSLSGMDFEKVLRKGQTNKAWVLLFLLSVTIAYCVSEFLLFLAGIS